MPDIKPQILLLSVIPSDFSKLFNLAKLLRENGMEPIFYFDQRAHSLLSSIEIAEKNSFKTFYNRYSKKTNSKNSKVPSKNLAKIKPLIFAKRLFTEFKNGKKKIKSFYCLLKDNEISLLITSLNMYGYDLPLYKKAADLAKIKIICLPFAIGDKDALEKAIFAQKKSYPDYLFNTFLGNFFQNWKVYTKRGIHLGLPAETLLTYKLLNAQVKIPLSFYGLGVDYLLMENEYMYDHALIQGIGAKETVVTGAVFDDKLFELKSNKQKNYDIICKQYHLNKNKKCILIALPPLVNENRNDLDYLNFTNLLAKFLPSSIDFSGYNVIISPHPRIEDKFKDLQLSESIAVIKEPAEILLPVSDLFITTFSSTIRTAAALGKPILNYDFLSFEYNLFSDLPNMITVIREEDYKENLLKWMFDPKGFIDNQNVSYKLSSTIDGKSGERILTKIREVLEK